MALTDTQKAEIRRVLGYPDLGAPRNNSGIIGAATLHSFYRWYEPYEWMETQLNSLTTDEEVQLFGQEHSSFSTYLVPAQMSIVFNAAGTVVVGTEVQLKVDGALLSYLTQSGDNPGKIAAAVSGLVTSDPVAGQLLIANPLTSATPTTTASLQVFARTIGAAGNGTPVQVLSSDPSLTVQIGSQNGQFAYAVTSGGADPPGIFFTPRTANVPTYGYIPCIRLLEADLIGARANLGTLEVDVIKRRPTELAEREALLNRWKREVADRLNIPLNPDLAGNRRTQGRRIV